MFMLCEFLLQMLFQFVYTDSLRCSRKESITLYLNDHKKRRVFLDDNVLELDHN